MVYYEEVNGDPYYHDHSSDKDSDDECELKPRRSCSFSEAEGMLGSSAHYESFTMESSPARPNGLHHRSRNNSHVQDSRRMLDIESEEEGVRRSNHFRTKKYNPNSTTYTNLVFRIFVFGVGLYILLVVRTMYWMYQNKDYSLYLTSNESHAVLPTFTHRATWAHERGLQIIHERGGDIRIEVEKRRQQRQARSTPPFGEENVLNDPKVHDDWYTVARLDLEPTEPQKMPGRGRLSADQLCGSLAKEAFSNSPESFSSKSAVNSKSVVVITGILNPLGFNLALQLKEKCGVQKVVGIDNMYPNTVFNRIQLQERIQLLTAAFPKMGKPVILSFIGLDPLYKKGSSPDESAQEEANLMDHKPTHIVHLSSYAQDVYSNTQVEPEWRNTHSPYIDEDGLHDSYMYQLRSSMVSMEQILASILGAAGKDRPQLLYASSAAATAATTNEDPRHATAKLIDEILADTYFT
eukprot:scaffold6130_cov131-Cylindrotheca_fusiformis.AAC.11